MFIADVLEEVKLRLWEEKGCSQGVDRCISPSLVVEAAGTLEEGKVVRIGRRSKEVERRDFEVRPDCEHVVHHDSATGMSESRLDVRHVQ
jgi:hypothetical protein